MVYTERVKDVVEYVGKNPINIKSKTKIARQILLQNYVFKKVT